MPKKKKFRVIKDPLEKKPPFDFLDPHADFSIFTSWTYSETAIKEDVLYNSYHKKYKTWCKRMVEAIKDNPSIIETIDYPTKRMLAAARGQDYQDAIVTAQIIKERYNIKKRSK